MQDIHVKVSVYCYITIIFTLTMLLSACGTLDNISAEKPQKASSTPKNTKIRKPVSKHVLIGKIYSVAKKKFISSGPFFDLLVSKKHVLIGELHENPYHHAIQNTILTNMIYRDWSGHLLLEMLQPEQDQILTHLDKKIVDNRAAMGELLNWKKRGWPIWDAYYPIFKTALSNKIPITHANYTDELMGNIKKYGNLAIPGTLRRKMHLDLKQLAENPIISKKKLEQLKSEVARGHCLAKSDKAVELLWFPQHARNAYMANRLSAIEIKTVLIAGYSHIRTDFAVPVHVRYGNKKVDVVSIGLIAVKKGMALPERYAKSIGGKKMPFDYVWFTPSIGGRESCSLGEQKISKNGM